MSTHVSNKDHSTIGNQIEEGLNLSVLFEKATYVFTVRLILYTTWVISIYSCGKNVRRACPDDKTLNVVQSLTLALILRINSVRHGRSRCMRSSIIESCTLSSRSRRGPPPRLCRPKPPKLGPGPKPSDRTRVRPLIHK